MPIAPKKIVLTRGQVAWVDAEDYERVNKFKWRAQKNRSGFVAAGTPGLMHRFILGVTDPNVFVDHKNHSTLDNQKRNLRIATKYTNGYNRLRNKNNASGHKGVYYQDKGWRFQINAGGVRYREWFKTLEEAIAARKEAAARLHGEFACDN